MALQEREVTILSYLLRYKYMNSPQIKRLFFLHQTNANMHRILAKLHALGLIERIRFPKTPNTNLGSLLYLSPKGAKCLAAEWGVSKKELGFQRITKPIQSLNHFYHRMRMVDFWIKLDEELEASHIKLKYLAADFHKVPKVDHFISKTTISTSDGAHRLIPDLSFILKNPEKGTEVVFFVEIDTGKETIMGRFKASKPGSLLYKYQHYERIMVDGGWKKSVDTTARAFQILTITEKQNHIQNIISRCKLKVRYPQLFLLSTHTKIQEKGVLFESIWDIMNDGEKKRLI